MTETFDLVIELFKNFNGNSFYMLFFLVALIYLYFNEEKKQITILLLYFSVFVLVLFLCPFFALVVTKILDDEIYYRTMWIFPIGIVVPYVITRLIRQQKKISSKIIVALMCILGLIYGGSFVYTHSYYEKAENTYHLPQEVVDICDIIIEPDRIVRATFPEEMVSFVRQYSSSIELSYGREILVANSSYNEIYYALIEDVINVSELTTLLREDQCRYLIISKDKAISEAFENYNFEVYDQVNEFIIYSDALLEE